MGVITQTPLKFEVFLEKNAENFEKFSAIFLNKQSFFNILEFSKIALKFVPFFIFFFLKKFHVMLSQHNVVSIETNLFTKTAKLFLQKMSLTRSISYKAKFKGGRYFWIFRRKGYFWKKKKLLPKKFIDSDNLEENVPPTFFAKIKLTNFLKSYWNLFKHKKKIKYDESVPIIDEQVNDTPLDLVEIIEMERIVEETLFRDMGSIFFEKNYCIFLKKIITDTPWIVYISSKGTIFKVSNSNDISIFFQKNLPFNKNYLSFFAREMVYTNFRKNFSNHYIFKTFEHAYHNFWEQNEYWLLLQKFQSYKNSSFVKIPYDWNNRFIFFKTSPLSVDKVFLKEVFLTSDDEDSFSKSFIVDTERDPFSEVFLVEVSEDSFPKIFLPGQDEEADFNNALSEEEEEEKRVFELTNAFSEEAAASFNPKNFFQKKNRRKMGKERRSQKKNQKFIKLNALNFLIRRLTPFSYDFSNECTLPAMYNNYFYNYFFMDTSNFSIDFLENQEYMDIVMSHEFVSDNIETPNTLGTFLKKKFYNSNYFPVMLLPESIKITLVNQKKITTDTTDHRYLQNFISNFISYVTNFKSLFILNSNYNSFKNSLSSEYTHTVHEITSYFTKINKKFFKNFQLPNFIEFFSFSLLKKDLNFFVKFLKKCLEEMPLKKHKKVLYSFEFMLKKFLKKFFVFTQVLGFKFEISGKISVTGNSKTRNKIIKYGYYSLTNKSLRIDYLYDIIRTTTGVLGFRMYITY